MHDGSRRKDGHEGWKELWEPAGGLLKWRAAQFSPTEDSFNHLVIQWPNELANLDSWPNSVMATKP
jgi:hypothetical protein